jgi:hypothetical protein
MNEAKRRRATSAYRLLSGITIVPGQVGNDVNEKTLVDWCLAVRNLAADSDRVRITDTYIGHVLAHSPLDPEDKAWPHRSVRAAIERLKSDDVAIGIRTERHNARGVVGKSIGEGGGKERILAEQARNWAAAVADTPWTAAMLLDLAKSWESSAEWEDARAAKDKLRH